MKINMKPNFLIASLLIFISITMIITLGEDDEDINDLINKGLDAENVTEYDIALSYFDRVLQIEPDNLQALNAKGVIFAKTANYDEALTYFDKILEIDPENVDAMINKVALFAEQGKIEKATQFIDRILEIDPNNVEALYAKGEVLLKKREYEQSLSYLDKVLQIEPDNLRALNAKGSIYQKQQKYEEALIYFDRILEIDPKYVDALFGKGGVLGELGDLELSIYHFIKVKTFAPNYYGVDQNYFRAINSLPTIPIEGNLMMHARNSDGKLYMYQESPTLSLHPLNLTSEFLDTLNVKETITRDGKDYDVIEVRQVVEIHEAHSLSEITLHSEGFVDFPVVRTANHGFKTEPGDVLDTLWTIYRPID